MKRKRSLSMQAGEYMALAMALPVSTFVGYGIGCYIDKWLGTHVFYLVFLLLGIASGLTQLIRQVTRENKEEDDDAK